jgi:hypothetical protein
VRRRDQLLQDSYEQLRPLPAERLRARLRIAYVNEAGMPEAGIDGGGLFKDFMEELLKQGFSPEVRARMCDKIRCAISALAQNPNPL